MKEARGKEKRKNPDKYESPEAASVLGGGESVIERVRVRECERRELEGEIKRESERAGVETGGRQCFSTKSDDIPKIEFSFLNVDYTRISWTVFALEPRKHEKLGLSICPWQ